jgi:capsular polysaccharide biosynthesis protein
MHVADWNGDGLADLLVGDVNSPTTTRPKQTLSKKQLGEYADFKNRTDADTLEISRLVAKREVCLDRDVASKIQRRIFELLRKRGDNYYDLLDKFEESVSSGTHGNVWVYLRKPTKAE